MRALILLSLLAAPAWADYATPGPYGSTRTSGSYAYNGASYGYELHVPSNVGGPFPVVALGHGFCNAPDNYRNFGELLASRGMIVVAPALKCSFLSAPHVENSERLLAALDTVVALGGAGGSLAGKVDVTRTALAGHSAGGLSALLAAIARPSVKALVLLDGVDNGTGSRASPVPTLFISVPGSNCNSQNNSSSWYNLAAAGQPKSRLRVAGAAHCDMQEPVASACTFAGCVGSSAVTVRPVFLRHAAAWLSAFLACDAAALGTVQQGGADYDADVTSGKITDTAQSAVALPSACGGSSSPDAGVPPQDGGVTSPDAGAGDAGWTDGGAPSQDGGQAQEDGGSPGVDAGQPARDGGTSADGGAAVPADGGAGEDAGAGGPGVPAVGCGCGHASGTVPVALLGWLAVLSARRKRWFVQ